MVSACRFERGRISDGEMRESSKSGRRPADRGETGTDRSPRRAQARSISFWRGRSGDRRAADQGLSIQAPRVAINYILIATFMSTNI